MADLESRLQALFNERSARRLAPASLLALGCGVALGGMALGAPALATGAGLVIGGIAVNIASSWIERLVMLPVEAEAERIELLEQGLATRDPGALAVATATLAAAGPQVAAALPDASRDQLAATLGQGMADAGGPLAALAPAYTAALSTPGRADWAAIRSAAQQQIQIVARVQAGERATIVRSGIAIADTEASVDASVLAGNDAQISDSPISVQGVRQPQPGYGISAGAGGTVKDSPLTVITNNLPDPEADRRRADVLGYLELTQHARNALDLSKIDPTDASYARPMELASVYIALNTTSTVEAEGAQRAERQRPLSAIEVIGRAPQGRVMLLGAPGSGKSTFVSHLAHGLAEAALAALRKDPTAAQVLEQLPGWRYGALLPVPIILRDLAAFPAVAAARRGSLGLICDFLNAQAADQGCAHAAEPLIAALRAGKALLLLDGLDEVVGDAVLPRVAEAIGDAANAFPGPILVTCRVLDYQEERLRQLAGFQTHTLADLEPAQMDTFIAAWYAELADSGRRPAAQAAAEARQMQGAVQSRDELRALAATPLLLTLMAQVHAFRGTLPDARARLYDECIDLLLLTWRQPRDGEEGLIARLGLSRFGSNDLLTLMARLGFTAHSLADRDRRSSGPADLSEAQVLEVLAERFADYDPDPVRSQTRAATVLQALARGNGLLLKRGPKTYTFAHRTFQEFLAGFHLKGMRNAQAACLERATQLHWHEALLLLAGYQVLRESELERPIALAEKLLARSPLEQALAGDLLVLVGAERARGFDATLVANGGLWPRAVKILREIHARGHAPDVPATLRHRAGLALGRLAYGELKDLALPAANPALPDPRLPLAMICTPLQAHPNWRRALEQHYWCPIEPGPFWSGDDRKGELKPAHIAQPYQIARYAVTNADFVRFLAANGPDGYEPDKPWWTTHGRTYLLPGGYRFEGEPEQITHPRFWSVARYNGPLQPVVGVTWYEAAAYCRWLTAEGHQAGWLPQEHNIRLPTWLEWERAARHTDQRRHPWGQEPPDSERANYRDTGIGAPSPVGGFPLGTAVCGVQDMLGNVIEWTATLYKRLDQTIVEKDFTQNDTVLVSWNSFANKMEDLCCGARYRNNPFIGNVDRSFRVVQSPCVLEGS